MKLVDNSKNGSNQLWTCDILWTSVVPVLSTRTKIISVLAIFYLSTSSRTGIGTRTVFCLKTRTGTGTNIFLRLRTRTRTINVYNK